MWTGCMTEQDTGCGGIGTGRGSVVVPRKGGAVEGFTWEVRNFPRSLGSLPWPSLGQRWSIVGGWEGGQRTVCGGFPSLRRLGGPPQPFRISASACASVLGVKNNQRWECKDTLSFFAVEQGFCYLVSKGAAGWQVWEASSLKNYPSVVHSFLWLNNIPIDGYTTTFCVWSHQLMDIWVVSSFWLLWIMLLWTHVFNSVCG